MIYQYRVTISQMLPYLSSKLVWPLTLRYLHAGCKGGRVEEGAVVACDVCCCCRKSMWYTISNSQHQKNNSPGKTRLDLIVWTKGGRVEEGAVVMCNVCCCCRKTTHLKNMSGSDCLNQVWRAIESKIDGRCWFGTVDIVAAHPQGKSRPLVLLRWLGKARSLSNKI
jgi:hypothetical protein